MPASAEGRSAHRSEATATTSRRLAIAAAAVPELSWSHPVDLAMRYADNPIAADRDLQGTLLLVSGQVKAIERRGTNEAEIRLGEDFNRNFDAYPFQVRCVFHGELVDSLARLRSGRAAEVVGICQGHVLGEVELRDCMLASSWSKKQRVGFGVSADEVMHEVVGFERGMYGYDKSEGDMKALFSPSAEADPRKQSIEFVGALDDPYKMIVTGADAAGKLSPTTTSVLAGTLKAEWPTAREWLVGILVSLEKRDGNSAHRAFGPFVVRAEYHTQLELLDLLATGPKAELELKEKRAPPTKQRMSITIKCDD